MLEGRAGAGALIVVLAALALSGCGSLEADLGIRAFFQSAGDDRPLDRPRGEPRPATEGSDTVTYLDLARGHIPEGELPRGWPELPRLAWRIPVGPAYSAIACAGGIAYTAEQRGEDEAVVALDIASGRELWVHSWPARFEETLSNVGPRSTPVVARDRVVFLGATGELRVLRRLDGELLWRTNVLQDGAAENLEYGLAATPLVIGGLVVATGGSPGDAGRGQLAAYELDSGATRWRALPETMTYASPVAATLAGTRQLVVVTATRIVALDPGSGDELWSHPWKVRGGIACTVPRVLGDDSLLYSSGYGTGAVRLGFSSDGTGLRSAVTWRSRRLKTRFNSMVVEADVAYGLDEGVLVRVDLTTGQRVWREGRYGYGHVLGSDGRLLVTTDDGRVLLVDVDADGPSEIAEAEPLDGITLTPPTVADGYLLLRSRTELVCLDLGGAGD